MGMIVLGTLALFAGVILARRFLVIVLIPASLAFLVCIVAWGFVHGSSFAGVAIAVFLVLTSLDVGYLLGYYVWSSGPLARTFNSSDGQEPSSVFVRPPLGGRGSFRR
jgi:hypothetical protein